MLFLVGKDGLEDADSRGRTGCIGSKRGAYTHARARAYKYSRQLMREHRHTFH